MAELQDQVQEFLDDLVASGVEVGLQAAAFSTVSWWWTSSRAWPIRTRAPVTPDALF